MSRAIFNTLFMTVSAGLLAGAATAVPTSDTTGDFLPTFAGAQGGDLDVASVEVRRTTSTFFFDAVLDADIGTTVGALYVWGIDRGLGTARFVGATPSVGAGVLFDSVLVLLPNGTGNFVDLLTPDNNFALAPGAITINGRTISGSVAISAIPTKGFAAADYTFNLWPRLGSIAGTTGISDFAPDASNIGSTLAVPEPATWAMLIAGFGGVGAAMRRRRRIAA